MKTIGRLYQNDQVTEKFEQLAALCEEYYDPLREYTDVKQELHFDGTTVQINLKIAVNAHYKDDYERMVNLIFIIEWVANTGITIKINQKLTTMIPKRNITYFRISMYLILNLWIIPIELNVLF